MRAAFDATMLLPVLFLLEKKLQSATNRENTPLKPGFWSLYASIRGRYWNEMHDSHSHNQFCGSPLGRLWGGANEAVPQYGTGMELGR